MYRTAFLKNSVLAITGILLAACHQLPKAVPLPYYNTPQFTPVFIPHAADVSKQINHTIGKFSMIDQHGRTITEQDTHGKIHVANFIFTSCGSICPVLTENMKRVQQVFRNNPNVVQLSYSVTPWIDSVPGLKKYALANAITSPQWHLLTGSKTAIYALARQSYFAEEDLGFSKDSSNFLHTEHMLLVDRGGHLRGIYNGTLQLETTQLISDINTLLAEK